MSWQAELDELHRREEFARRMGGPEKIRRQHDGGKLTVRERIERLLDTGSFQEMGAIAGAARYGANGELQDLVASNFVCGRGRIDGRPVVVGGDDFTVRGGAADASIWQKQEISEQMAGELGIPIVRLVDGTGGGGSVKTYETTGRTYVPRNPGWEHVVANLSRIPVVALGLGSVAGLGAARLVTAHYALMVRGISQMFVAGPPVVARVAKPVTKEELGGSEIHARNGAVDDEVDSEDEAFARARAFLSYLPRSIDDVPPRHSTGDDAARREDWLIDAIPRDRRKVYRMRPIVEACVDRGSFFEIGRQWGRSVITGLARLDGWPVAVLASDPFHYAGAWTADASHKVTRFVDMCETFHLPVVHFVDIPGFLIGIEGEKAATIRHGARALAAVYQAQGPWCTILVRKAFGVAGAAHQNFGKFNFRYAWPSGDWGSLPLEGGIEAAYRAEIEAAADPKAHLAAIEERLNRVRSPFRTAENFGIEEIIDPRDTRRLLCDFANLVAPLRKPGPRTFGMRP